jgi:hypothetical protein
LTFYGPRHHGVAALASTNYQAMVHEALARYAGFAMFQISSVSQREFNYIFAVLTHLW